MLLVGVTAFFFLMNGNQAMSQDSLNILPSKLLITGTNGQAIVCLYDTPVSKDFILLLPLSVTLSDFMGEEKIASLPRKLITTSEPTAGSVQGDFTYYAPWGNLAIFYKGFGKDRGLRILGYIESGKDWLAEPQRDFIAKIEIIEQETL